jgi:hypothetical protein
MATTTLVHQSAAVQLVNILEAKDEFTQSILINIGWPTPEDPWGNPVNAYIIMGIQANTSLRKGESSPLAEWMTLGIKCHPKFKGKLYRGLKKDFGWTVGEVIEEAGFTATSSNPMKVNKYLASEGSLLVIEGEGYNLGVEAEHQEVDVIQTQVHSGEDEVVILPGAKFLVMDVDEVEIRGGIYKRYHLKQI